MKFISRLLGLAFAGFIGLSSAAEAQYQPGAIVSPTVPAMASITGGHWGTNFPNLYLAGYLNKSDGGEGVFQYSSTSCIVDTGYCVRDLDGNYYKRTNLNGSLRQYGAVAGSTYDITANPTTAISSTALFTAAFVANGAMGITTLHTDGISVFLGTTLTIGSGQAVSCDTNGWGSAADGHYYGKPGTLVTAHLVTILANGDDAHQGLSKCIIVPQWYVNPSTDVVSAFGGYTFNQPPQVYDDLERMRANAILAADTGVTIQTARGGNFNSLGIYCFDVGISAVPTTYLNVGNTYIDADVSIYTKNGGGTNNFTDVHSANFCTRQVDNASGHTMANEEYWSISSITQGATNSFGTHNCRVTLTGGFDKSGNAVPATDVKTSILDSLGSAVMYPAWMSNIKASGGLACNGIGPWAINVISSNPTTAVVDLIGSELGTGADKIAATASWSQGYACASCNYSIIRISTGDTNGMQAGEVVAGTGIPVGSQVLAVVNGCRGIDPYDGYITCLVIDHALTLGGVDAAITLDGGTYASLGACNGRGNSPGCFFLNAAERVYSGNTDAGNFSATLPLSRGKRYSVSWLVNATTGFRGSLLGTQSHHYSFVSVAANGCTLEQNSEDDNKELNDQSTVSAYNVGNTNKCTLAGAIGASGTAIVNDTFVQNDDNTHSTTISGSVGTGLQTITTNTSMAGWPKDTQGHTTAVMCQVPAAGLCPAGSEYVTIDIAGGGGTASLLARGVSLSAPIALTNGATIMQSNTAGTNGKLDLHDAGANVIDADLTVFELLHGNASLNIAIVSGGGRVGFISENIDGAHFVGTIFKDMTLFYSSGLAFPKVAGCTNSFVPDQPWECYSPNPIAPTITTSTTIDTSSHFWPCDATAGNVTLTMFPSALDPNWTVEFIKTDSSANRCSIVLFSGDSFLDGSTTYYLYNQTQSTTIKGDGVTKWLQTN